MHRIGTLDGQFTSDDRPADSRSAAAGMRDARLGIDFSLVTTREAFDALEGEWNGLFSRAGRSTHVFQTFNWCWHWCNQFLNAGDLSLAVVTAWRDGRLVMVWPLVRGRSPAGTELSWLGEPVSQYGDILAEATPDRAERIEAAWRFVVAQLRPGLVRLRKVRDDADIAPLLKTLASVRSAELEAPFLDLASAGDAEAYFERYSSKARRNRRRLMRRLEEQGKVEFEKLPPGNAARYAAGQAIAMKQAWLASRGLLSPALADPRTLAFFQDAAESRLRPVGCQVSMMTVKGEPAGAHVAFECCGRRAVHLIAYNLAYEKSGVGVLHLERSIETAFGDGIDTIDMLAPKADYKMDWADGAVPVADHAVALSWRGKLYARFYLGWARERLKALVEASPAWVKARLGRTQRRESE